MTFNALLDNAAQWLNEHAVAAVIVFAMLALLIERLCRVNVVVDKRQWSRTWITNGALLGCTLLLSWLLAPWLSPAFSHVLSSQIGLLVWLDVANSSYALSVILGVLLLDLINYAVHRFMHAVPLLWRLHQVHHSDVDMNASTHFRQHPLQLVAALCLQLPLLWLFGISGVSWVLYATASLAIQLWQHADLDLRTPPNHWIGWVLVTPAMHQVHHDQRQQFHDTNYGALFPFWDRLLGTYTAALRHVQPGLRRQDGKPPTSPISFTDCLWMPFQSSPTPAKKPAAKHAKEAALPKFKTSLQGKK